jgi:hypothetical protein
MDGIPALVVPVFQLVLLPVLAGYLMRRAIGGTTGTVAGIGVALALAAWFAVNLDVPGK